MVYVQTMCSWSGLLVVLYVVGIAGQNQVPPGRRRPPFIVVPPEGERAHASGSNRRDLSAAGPEVVLRPDEQIMVPEQRPQPAPNNPQPAPNQPNQHQPFPDQHQPFPDQRQPFPDQHQPFPDQRQPFPGQHQPPPANQPQPPPSNQPQVPQKQPAPHLPILTPAQKPALNRPNLPPIDQRCFHCICMASSGCDQELRCVQPSPNQYFCGQYHISWAYWADSGKPGDIPDFPGAWEDCLLDNTCAERSIQSYMNKFAGDCNNDGNLDCVDYARIHKAGPPPSCNATWVDDSAYWHRFVSCWGGGLDLRSKGKK